MKYVANSQRYSAIPYRRCGESGLDLPVVSLGFWHNFGYNSNAKECREIMKTAFDNGITYFDLANNYGMVYGSAESNFGKWFSKDFASYREQIVIATKAGYDMWEGPYGDFGSKKYLMSSLEQSLRRMKLDYVDIFYHHRFDPSTPLEEIAHTLDLMVKQGKTLYVGVSNYNAEQTAQIKEIFTQLKTPFIVNQPCYNMLNRKIETDGLDTVAIDKGVGLVAYSPLAQGLLTDRYADSIPENSRASMSKFLTAKDVDSTREKVNALKAIAQKRGQSLSQMALAFALNNKAVTSVIVGASSVNQLLQNIGAVRNLQFTVEELNAIDKITK